MNLFFLTIRNVQEKYGKITSLHKILELKDNGIYNRIEIIRFDYYTLS